MKGKQTKRPQKKQALPATPEPKKKAPKQTAPSHRVHARRTKYLYVIVALMVMMVTIPAMTYGGYWWMYRDMIYPGVDIETVVVGGATRQEATDRLTMKVAEFTRHEAIQARYEDRSWEIPLPEPSAWQVEVAANDAFYWGRQGSWQERLRAQWHAWQAGVTIPLSSTLPDDWVEGHAATIAAQLDQPLIPPSVMVTEDERIVATAGEPGRKTQVEQLQRDIVSRLTNFSTDPVEVKVEPVAVSVTIAQLDQAQVRGAALVEKTLTLNTADETSPHTWELTGEELVNWIAVTGGWNETTIAEYLAEVAHVVDRPPQNAKFQFDQTTGRVTEFAPALDGLTVNRDKTLNELLKALDTLEIQETVAPVSLVMERAEPEITLASVNDLGIQELLGRGESTYKGSIASRVHNVRLASERINGTLVKPGEEFSFNNAIGEVSGATGYQQAYIIKDGRTQLGDGGGVCQSSTTVFRAALAAGLPITERRAHAYRVGYYEQDVKAGIDATVYAPSTDLKFLNDTPGHLLVQTIVDEPNRHLIYEIYGTSDGRESAITNHTVCCIVPPPPDIFQDDPTLPTGTVKEVDHKVAGAKAKFDYTVTRNGETIFEKTYYSNYKPWAAVFLRGTGP